MVCDRRARNASFRFCTFIHMAVQLHLLLLPLTWRREPQCITPAKTFSSSFSQSELPPGKTTYPRCNLFIFVYKRTCWSLLGRTRSVQGTVSVLTGQADTSVGCCTSVLWFMGSPTAPLLCFSTCTRTCTSQCSLQAERRCLTENKSKHKLWPKSSSR